MGFFKNINAEPDFEGYLFHKKIGQKYGIYLFEDTYSTFGKGWRFDWRYDKNEIIINYYPSTKPLIIIACTIPKQPIINIYKACGGYDQMNVKDIDMGKLLIMRLYKPIVTVTGSKIDISIGLNVWAQNYSTQIFNRLVKSYRVNCENIVAKTSTNECVDIGEIVNKLNKNGEN